MRSILRSTLLASFALVSTWGFSGCEDTSKPVTPPVTTGGATEPEKPKMEPEKPKMEPEKPKMEPEKAADPAPPK